MKKNNKTWITLVRLVLLTLIIQLSACNSSTSKTTPSTGQDSTLSTAYPEPIITTQELSMDAGYPVDRAEGDVYEEYPLSIEIPTPSGGKGVVTGQLVFSANQEPYLAPALYLGSYMQPEEDSGNLPQAISVTIETDPKAIQAQDGTFVFSDVEPGRYALFIWTPMNLMLIRDLEGSAGDYTFVVAPGEILDLGTINVD